MYFPAEVEVDRMGQILSCQGLNHKVMIFKVGRDDMEVSKK